MATFNETHQPTSKKYVSEQGIKMSNLSEKPQFLWSQSSGFAFEKQLKNLNF